MPSHLAFFLLALSFLSGIFFVSLGLSLSFSLIVAAVLFAALFATNVSARISVIADVLLAFGCFYYQWDDQRYQAAIAAIPANGVFEGTIVDVPKVNDETQLFTLQTSAGKLAVSTASSTRYAYGDIIRAKGKITPPGLQYAGRHIVGLMHDPTIERIGAGGNPILRALFGVRKRIEVSYDDLLTPQRSALLFGIIFGVNYHFSKSFSEDLQLSGLRFITAIDGLHMQIVIAIILVVLTALLPRRFAFVTAFVFAGLFIALTGFTVSGIRAALMAFIGQLANETRRLYLPHNALALVALVLALQNPKVLLFDVGFQLSFLAVISIIYLLPALSWLLRLSEDPGFLAWKESLLITIAVQLATAPLIMSQFQTFSLTSFAASVLTVWMLPFIIVLGLAMALFTSVLYPIAGLLALVLAPLLDYFILVIHLFARLSIAFNPPLGFVGVAVYYASLVLFLYWFYTEPVEEQPERAAPQPVPLPFSETVALAETYEIIEIP